MQRIYPRTHWYENDDFERWEPPVPGAQPPNGFHVHVQRAVLVCNKTTRNTEQGDVRYESIDPSTTRAAEMDLVLAMSRPSFVESRVILQRALLERRQQLPAALADRIAFTAQVALGRATLPGLYTLNDAMLIASLACDRCRMALAWQYGLPRGYPATSSQYAQSTARCEFCEPEQPTAPKAETVVEPKP